MFKVVNAIAMIIIKENHQPIPKCADSVRAAGS